jgi:pyroglutamyl-peptidase
MPSVLITAFEPYDSWSENSSWLTLVELTKSLPSSPRVTTRRYPVDFERVRERLEKDLTANYDYVVHLGQAPGSARVRLESVALNVGGSSGAVPEDPAPLMPDGPLAYRSSLPLPGWAEKLRQAGIPSQVSFHAGTYVCNATLYWSHYWAEQKNLKTRALLLHLPLATTQTLRDGHDMPALPSATLALGVRLILDEMASELV